MDVYIYTLDLTEDGPEIEIMPGEAVELFRIGNYIEYNIQHSVSESPSGTETIMHGLSNREMDTPFFSTDNKCVFLVATDLSNKTGYLKKIFGFCNEEWTKLLTKDRQMIRGMNTVNNYLEEMSNES